MKQIIGTLVLIGLVCCSSLAQNTYQTRNAVLTLNGALGEQALNLQTRELSVRLDYETAYLIIQFPLRSLQSVQPGTVADSVLTMLDRSATQVVFDGKLGLEFINTEDHPPMHFKTEGLLTIGTTKTVVQGKGELHHLSNTSDFACALGMTMQLSFQNLGIHIPLTGLADNFEVVITQALLQRDKN
ncbi:MAG: hypothetical protein KDD14_18420 [Saprospiraceae bacterium]|nr:hypothetical protein [Saprospiraceae bacterium]